MTDHPITPPPELVQQWVGLLPQGSMKAFTVAAQWGSDQELEACCEWLMYENDRQGLRAARRPKTPSLKEQALAKTTAILNDPNRALLIEVRETLELNCRALKQLDDCFCALCKELVDALLCWQTDGAWIDQAEQSRLIARACAALAQPKPVRPEPVVPTVMEIIELHSWLDDEWQANNDGEDLPALDFARAVLAKWGTSANTTKEEI